jgi:hypothetical protein
MKRNQRGSLLVPYLRSNHHLDRFEKVRSFDRFGEVRLDAQLTTPRSVSP